MSKRLVDRLRYESRWACSPLSYKSQIDRGKLFIAAANRIQRLVRERDRYRKLYVELQGKIEKIYGTSLLEDEDEKG